MVAGGGFLSYVNHQLIKLVDERDSDFMIVTYYFLTKENITLLPLFQTNPYLVLPYFCKLANHRYIKDYDVCLGEYSVALEEIQVTRSQHNNISSAARDQINSLQVVV